MKYSFKSPLIRLLLALFIVMTGLTIAGRYVRLTSAVAVCAGWPLCVPSSPHGWYQFAHQFLVGLALILAVWIFRKAWREYRNDQIVLPLVNVMVVLFFGQSFLGALRAAGNTQPHIVYLHLLTAISLWIVLSALIVVAGLTAGAASEIEKPNAKQRAKDFFALSKPLIVALLLITTYGGLVIGTKGFPSASLTFWTLLGGALAAGGSSALNQFIDRNLDKNMVRTSKRPLADGRLTPAEGLSFGIVLCLLSYYVMAGMVNLLAAILSLVGIFYYVFFYSVWLKKATVQNIVIGGGAGAIPPMVGWAAATNNLGLTAWILFAIIFMWTPPHFWALAIVRMKDYENAGVPMLPVVRGEAETRKQILIYTVILVLVTLLLPIFNLAGSFYLVSSIVLGGLLLYAAWVVWREGGAKVSWRMYKWSSMYLLFIFAAIVVDAVVSNL